MRKMSRLLRLLVLVVGYAVAQQPTPPVPSDYDRPAESAGPPWPAQLIQELTTIRDAGLSDDYAYRLVAHLTENIGARPVGSPQAQAAIEYVAGEMRKLDLDVRLEPVEA